MRLAGFAGAVVSAYAAVAAPSQAQSVAEFYKGKQVTIIVGSAPGGGYDATARLFARFMGTHLPGNPNMIVQNMPGAGSLTATNNLYNLSPKDGTYIGVVQRGMLTAKLTNPNGVRFDVEKMNWIGNLAPEVATIVSWKNNAVKTTDDLFKTELIVGGPGPTLDPETVPRLLNALIGTKFRIVSGYTGNTEILLAMERGEVGGTADLAWSNVKRRTDLRPNLNVLMQVGLEKAPDLDVPLALDFAKNEEDREIMELFFIQKTVARPLVAPPGVPADRVAALRTAFIDMTKDKTFVTEAEKLALDIEPATGEDIQKIIAKIAATPQDIADKLTKAITAPK
jgi:tripartite-type tricarboxylate transporter receptor subunit TctC